MIEFQWIAPRGLLEHIRSSLRPLLAATQPAHLPEAQAHEDPELAAILRWEIEQGIRDDRAQLRAFLDEPTLGEGLSRVSVEQAEAMIRALTNLRLFIRSTHLESIQDEVLEQGDFEPGPDTAAATHKFYAIYGLLGSLQQLLLELLEAHESAGEQEPN